MKKIIIIFAIGLAASQLIKAQGTTYMSNVGQPSTGSEAVGNDSWLAAGFETGTNSSGYIINSIQLGMLDATGNPSDLTVMLYVESLGGNSPGRFLGTLTGSLSPTTAGAYTYTLPFNHTFVEEGDYFIVLTSGTAVADGAYDWSLTGTSSYNRIGGWFNEPFLTSSDGSSWSRVAGIFPQFSITATPIPEPSVLGLLALGGLGFFWHRRKVKAAC
jgi:hypothetical protein